MIMHCKLFFLFLVGEGKIYDYHSVNITDLRLCREWHHLLTPLTITHLQESTGLLNHLKDWIMGKDLSSKIMIPRLIVGLLLSCHLLLQVIMEPAVQLRLPDFRNQKELGHLLCSLETRNFQETLVKLPIQGLDFLLPHGMIMASCLEITATHWLCKISPEPYLLQIHLMTKEDPRGK